MKISGLERVALASACRRVSARQNFGLSRRRSALLLGVAVAAFAAGAPDAIAVDLTWTGGAGTLVWNDGANWQSGNAPTPDDAVTIDSSTTATGHINVDGAGTSGSLTIGGLGGKRTTSLSIIYGNTLAVSGELTILAGGQVAVTQVDSTVPDGIGLRADTIDVTQGGELDVANSTVHATTGVTLSGDKTTKMQGSGGILVTDGTFVQTGGKQGIDLVVAPSYDISGGTTSTGEIDFSTDFSLSETGNVDEYTVLVGGAGSTMEQSGDTMMNGLVSGIASYTHSGGSLGGSVTTGTYDLTDASATSAGATIDAANFFRLEPASGTATVEAYLTGAGKLVKSGDATVVLTNALNDFTGGVDIESGTLDVLDDALPDDSAVKIGDGATLQMTAASDVVLTGTMTGDTGALVKDGIGTLTLGGDVTLGGLSVAAGKLEVGTGTSTNTASFESAVIAADATLHVAQGATLIIRVPNSITNRGHFINDGTVDDDLANVGPFENNGDYDANVASNTGTINNNTPGVWTGNVVTNAGTISNNAGAKWQGDVKANSGHIANAAGATWTGDIATNFGGISNHGTWIGDAGGNGADGGPGSIYNDGAGATWTGDVIDDNSQIVNTNGATWTGNVNGNNNVVFNMAGSFWHGNVVASGGGANDLAQIDNRGAWTGTVDANAGMIFNTSGSWTGNVLANTGLIVNNDNDLNLNPTGDNHAVWAGGVATNAGRIVNDHGGIWNGDVTGNGGGSSGHARIDNHGTWTGDVAGNSGGITNAAGSLWNGEVAANGALGLITNLGLWSGNVLSNVGTIDNRGTWTGNVTSAGTVNAEGTISGDVTNNGLLHLTGALSGIGTLTNNGMLDLRGGGAVHTLSAANADFGAGSFYAVDIDSSGASDRLAVTGTAALAGTVQVSAMLTGSPYDTTTSYTILTAGGGLGGTSFDGATTDLAFLAPRLSYDADDVHLTLKRNDVGFSTVGVTADQKAAAAGAEALGAGNPIYDAILWLNDDQAQQAFEQLSGETYASMQSSFVQNADLLGNAMSSRIDQAFDALGAGGGASSYADGPTAAALPTKDTGVWGQIYGAHGSVAASGGAAGLDASTGGIAGGFDRLAGDWRLGLMLQAGRTSTAAAGVNASSSSTDYGLGAYGGRQWGGTRLTLGAAYTRHDVSSTRSVAFPGFTDTLSARYATGTAQAFAKVSHDIDLGAVSLIPYASLAYVRQDTDGFTETGGAAALTSAPGMLDATFTTVGVGANRKFAVGDAMLLTAKGSVGWRHAFANAPGSTMTLAGGTSFSVIGAPVIADTVAVNAGLNLDVSADTTFDLNYDGQFGANTRTHSVKGTWGTRF